MYFLGKPIYEWIYNFIGTCVATFLVVFPYFMLNSCKIMHKLKDGNRRGLCTLAGMFFPIGFENIALWCFVNLCLCSVKPHYQRVLRRFTSYYNCIGKIKNSEKTVRKRSEIRLHLQARCGIIINVTGIGFVRL